MIVTLWGVRGTFPTTGDSTLRYGGNTSCVSVQIEDRVLILDAGSGVRELGQQIQGNDLRLYFLFSHLHSDHLIGFPFFEPLFEPGREIHLLKYQKDGHDWSPLALFDGVHFPLRPHHLPSIIEEVSGDVEGYLRKHGFNIDLIEVNHPGGAYGFRVEHKGRVLIHVPDNELHPPSLAGTPFGAMVDFCRNADVLVHDAQYIRADLPLKRGWGHSRVGQVCELATAAQIRHLILFHHDPGRTDDELDQIQKQARTYLKEYDIECTVAFEGLRLNLD